MGYTSRVVVVLAALSVSSPTLAQELVTTCGQRVTDGVLANDLDCTGVDGAAVTVDRSLSLAGYTITGGEYQDVIGCVGRSNSDTSKGKCSLSGPGTVRASGSGGDGIRGKKLLVDGVSFENVYYAVSASTVTVSNSVLTGPFPLATGGCLVDGKRVTVTGSSISGSAGFGVCGVRRVVVVDTTVTGNAWDGVTSGGLVELFGSSVIDNALSCVMPFYCGFDPSSAVRCADVSATKRVQLDATASCGTSLIQEKYCRGNPWDYRPGTTHGVCAQD